MTETPPKRMTFDEKLFQKAWDLAGQTSQFESEMSVYRNIGLRCGVWARDETIREVVELLRNTDDEDEYGESIHRNTANWLESKLSSPNQESVNPELTDESKVKLKDPSFVLPEYY